MNFLRDIKKIKINNGLRAVFTRWVIGKDLNETVPILFQDGVISINSTAKVNIQEYQAENFGFTVNDGSDLITKYGLKDGDLFLGRDSNYILFRDGNINIKSETINIDVADINITCGTININGVALTFTGGKALIGGIEIAVVGGDISTGTNKIITSGQ